MLNYQDFVISLGRAVELLRTAPDAVGEQKALLRKLVALSALGGATIRPAADGVTADGYPVPATLPGVRLLRQQMDTHGVDEIAVSRHASAADLLQLLRVLAVSLGGFQDGRSVADRLRDAGVDTVVVGSVDADPPRTVGRPVTESEAREPASALTATEGPPSSDGEVAVERHATPLDAALAALDADFMGADVLNRASRVGREIAGAIADDRLEEAVRALARLVRLESGLPESSPRRSLGIVLKRLLTPAALRRVTSMLFVPDRREDAVATLARGGAVAAEQLVERLGAVEVMQERRVYFDAIRDLGDAMADVLHLLEDERWHVVRNVAELMGEARVEGAVPALGRHLEHPDPRVRRAAAVALARIGTPATADLLRRALRESDTTVRALVAGAVQERPSAALAMPLALAAEQEVDADLQREFYRALGRIGTPDAIQALVRAAQPGGRFIGRKPAGPRLAAIEGLRAAADPLAHATLQGLAEDRVREVRRAARRALDDSPAA